MRTVVLPSMPACCAWLGLLTALAGLYAANVLSRLVHSVCLVRFVELGALSHWVLMLACHT
jgi:hypothetical protein